MGKAAFFLRTLALEVCPRPASDVHLPASCPLRHETLVWQTAADLAKGQEDENSQPGWAIYSEYRATKQSYLNKGQSWDGPSCTDLAKIPLNLEVLTVFV